MMLRCRLLVVHSVVVDLLAYLVIRLDLAAKAGAGQPIDAQGARDQEMLVFKWALRWPRKAEHNRL